MSASCWAAVVIRAERTAGRVAKCGETKWTAERKKCAPVLGELGAPVAVHVEEGPVSGLERT